MNKVLLIGSNGLLGRSVKSKLIDDGYSVTGVTRSEGFDLSNNESFQAMGTDYQCVINLAAIIDISEDSVDEAVRVNGIGALRAAIFAKSAGAMFIHASTISALPCCNNEYCNSYYAATKRLGDDLIKKYCGDNHMEYSILRFPQLYDTERKAEKYQPMLYRIIQQVKHNGSVTLYGNNNPSRNYLHVDDAAKAISISLNTIQPGIWNCLHPSSDDVLGLVKVVSEAMDTPVKIVRLENESDLQEIQMPDKELFHQSCPEWKPRSLATGIKDIVSHA